MFNLAHLCWDCHYEVHHERASAETGGWVVRSADDPSQVPVALGDGRRVYLTSDGKYREANIA